MGWQNTQVSCSYSYSYSCYYYSEQYWNRSRSMSKNKSKKTENRRCSGYLVRPSRADAPKHESRLGFYDLAVHFEQRIDEKIDRAAGWFRIDHQIAALGEFKPIGRVMAKVIIGELRISPRFTDIHRHPPSIRQKFSPAMVAVDRAFLFVSGNGRANGETSGYADAACQSNEISVKIGAIAGARVTCVHGVATAPASSRFVVAHPPHHVVIDRLGAVDIVSFSRCRFLSKCLEGRVNRYQFFRAQVTASFGTACSISSFFLAHDVVSNLDCFAAVSWLGMEDTNVIAVIPILNLFPFHWDIQLFNSHALKSVSLRQRNPDASIPCDFRKFNSIDKLELICPFDNSGFAGGMNSERARQKNDENGDKLHR